MTSTAPESASPKKNMPLVKAGSAPLFRQIKDHILRMMQEGTMKAGDRLPSESELVAKFGVSRMTVNRALRELTDQGRITRVAGAGSFVAEPKPQANLLRIVNLAKEIRQRGHDYRCEMHTAERVSANLEVATSLGLFTGESVYHSVCVHFEDDLPIQLEDRFVNPGIVPDFITQDFSRQQPSEFLVRTVPYDEIEHVVDAVLPTAEQARLLEMDAAGPCLLLTRRTWIRDAPITLVRCYHPADRYRLGSRYKPD